MKKTITFCIIVLFITVSAFSANVTISGNSSYCTGDVVTLTANTTCSGCYNYSYQWYKSGNPILNATNSTYVIGSVALSDTGVYKVDVLYEFALMSFSMTSPNFNLVVRSSQAIVLTGGNQNQTVCPGTPINSTVYTFGGGATSATVSGNPNNFISTSVNNSAHTVTISGTPVASGTYTITTSGNICPAASVNGTITITPQSTLVASGGSLSQALCSGIAITPIVFTYGGSATAVSVNNLLAGLTTNNDAINHTLTISGTPTQSGVYTVTTISPCTNVSINGTITVSIPQTISFTGGLQDQSVCVRAPISTTTYTYGGGANNATVTMVPTNFISSSVNTGTKIVTINGTPNSTGTYTITTSGNSCQPATISGTITVLPQPTLTLTGGQLNQTLCPGVPIPTITVTFGGGATSVIVNNLPPGLLENVNLVTHTLTITGTPTQTGNFTIITVSPCTNTSLNGSIAFYSPQTIAWNSSSGAQNQTLCAGADITQTTYTFGGGANNATVNMVPSNFLTASVNTVTKTVVLSGTANSTGTYTITTSGNSCQPASISGTITVIPQPTLNSSGGAQSQTNCSDSAISPIVFTFDGSATAVTVNNLPAGLVQTSGTNTLSISGTPSTSGTYTVTTVSPCTDVSLSGTISIIPPLNLSLIEGDNSVCRNQLGVSYHIGNINNALYSWNVAGGIITSGSGTPQIIVDWGLSDTTGLVSVDVTVNGCTTVQTLSVPISQSSAYNLDTIVPKINIANEPYMLIYPNPPAEGLYYQWYENGDTIGGANEQFFYPPKYNRTLNPGSCYSVFVALSSYQDCGNFTKCYTMPGGKSMKLTIFPNPSEGNFYLNIGKDISIADSHLSIYSLDGKIVFEKSIGNREELNFNLTLRNGFYFVQLVTVNGESYVEKLIIE